MQTYLVGGAVRDLMMGLEPKDRDFVVVGSTEQQMLDLGFSKVGADFPVFLHPETGDEYALARRERKTGKGYTGFTCEFDPSVTLTEDLARRDLTMGAMAGVLDWRTGEVSHVFDPFGGSEDLKNKVLRHVSDDAFVEDPVRVLRLARFSARYSDFTLAADTVRLCQKMASDGVLAELQKDRVWKETSRALVENDPRRFFDTLLDVGALSEVFPEVAALVDTQENVKWHPEGNTYEHTMLVLTAMSKLRPGSVEDAMFALVHDFGKALTPKHLQPKHHGHDAAGVPVVEKFMTRLGLGGTFLKRAKILTRHHMKMHLLDQMKASTFIKMFEDMDAFRDEEIVEHLMWLGAADHRGRLGHENADFGQLFKVVHLHAAAVSVKFDDLGVAPPPTTKVERVKELFFKARTQEIVKWLN